MSGDRSDTAQLDTFADEFRSQPVSIHPMTETTLTRARAGDEAAFRELTDRYRRELQVHCYRILGSLQDAEDLTQETMLAAWRGLDGYEGRASMRTWLYRIATNRCLNALRDSGRRPQADLSGFPPPTRVTEPVWLEPYPDALFEEIADLAPGPEARYEAKESIALAFMMGLQHLPPRQRAVLVLKDVLGFSSAETAELLGDDASEASVNSALQRARATLAGRLGSGSPADRDRAPLPRSARERELVERFAEAFTAKDVGGIVALLTEDASLSMPPEPWVYEGLDAIDHFFRAFVFRHDHISRHLIPVRANGQPAFGYYMEDRRANVLRCYGILVLTLAGDGIAGITRFGDSGVLPHFGLPRTLRP
jgi:RNA polymerase sigma-70 factor (ECF subfamily)